MRMALRIAPTLTAVLIGAVVLVGVAAARPGPFSRLPGAGNAAISPPVSGTTPGWNAKAVSGIESSVQKHMPTFPDRTCSVTDPKYAGLVRQVTDGINSSVQSTVWYYGDAINAAIADCHTHGGGVVVVPATGSMNGDGVFFSGAITLLSNVDLDVQAGATIKFVRNPTNAFYPVVLTSWQGIDYYGFSPLVYALNQTNIAVTGGGTLDAQDNIGGGWTFPATSSGTAVGSFNELAALGAEGVPVDHRIFSSDGTLPASIETVSGCPKQSVDWGACKETETGPPPPTAATAADQLLPLFVEFNHSENVLMQGVHLVNTLFWQVHPLQSKDVDIQNITVDDTAHHTDDGIDPESSHDVIVENNDITVLDDGVAVKSGRDTDGRTLRAPSSDILIRGNTFNNPNGGSASISIGSELSGSVFSVFAENNSSNGAGTAYLLKLKTNSFRGGVVQGIYVRNSTINQTIRGVVNFDDNNSESPAVADADVFNPVVRDIFIDNVNTAPTVATTFPAFVISNADSRVPFQNVVYENSTFQSPATFQSAFGGQGAFFHNLTIRNVQFVNPSTGAVTNYNSAEPDLLDQTMADVNGKTVKLTAAPDPGSSGGSVNKLKANTFTLSGKVDSAADPGFLQRGTVSFRIDRATTPMPVTVKPDGSFTSAPITLSNDIYWYQGMHFIAVTLADGINVNTIVYEVRVPGPGPSATTP